MIQKKIQGSIIYVTGFKAADEKGALLCAFSCKPKPDIVYLIKQLLFQMRIHFGEIGGLPSGSLRALVFVNSFQARIYANFTN